MNWMVKVRDTAERKIPPNLSDQEDEDIEREKEKR